MSIISRFFNVLETRLTPPRFSLWRTIYFNLRTQPFSRAIHLPFFIYGKVKFPTLAGKIIIAGEGIRRGMIKIGQQDPFDVSSGRGFIAVAPHGTIVFNGPTVFRNNVCVRVLGGELTLGKYSKLCSEVKVICNGGVIYIGDYVPVSFQSVVINSGFHSIFDIHTLNTSFHVKDIYIGEKTWIGNRTTIAGGARLKPNTIVAAGSYVNKDFTTNEENYQLIAGTPARIIRSDIVRIWSPVLEMKIVKFFESQPYEKTYHINSLSEDKIEEREQDLEFN